MRRFLAIFSALALCLSLAACDLTETPESTEPSVSVADSTQPSQSSAEENTQQSTAEESTELSSEDVYTYSMGDFSVRTYRDENGAVWAMYQIPITNTCESSLAMSYANVSLSDDWGEVLAEMKCTSAYPSVLLPGESGYFCDVIPLDVSQPSELGMSISVVLLPAEEVPVRYDVPWTTLKNSTYGGLELSATVENNTQEDGELVCVCALLQGEDGKFLGFITGYLDEPLPAGESRDVVFESFMLPPELTTEQVARVVTFAYPV